MPTNNPTDSTVPPEPVTLDEILDINGDPGLEPALPPHVADFLGKQLQSFYAHLMDEPVPDRLLQILEQLDRQENGRDGK